MIWNTGKILFQYKVMPWKIQFFLIVDDLLAKGGTVNCVSRLLQVHRKEVLGLITVVELKKLEGRLRINFPVQSMISFWKEKESEFVVKCDLINFTFLWLTNYKFPHFKIDKGFKT